MKTNSFTTVRKQHRSYSTLPHGVNAASNAIEDQKNNPTKEMQKVSSTQLLNISCRKLNLVTWTMLALTIQRIMQVTLAWYHNKPRERDGILQNKIKYSLGLNKNDSSTDFIHPLICTKRTMLKFTRP